MSRLKINDGLTKTERYRLKDLDAYREKKKNWAKTDSQREYRRNYMRMWREKNREQHNKLARESHHRNKHKHIEYFRAYNLRKNYNITIEEYNNILEKQEGKCCICGKENNFGARHLHVDHDHNTGKIRGLLCSKCNGSLGWHEKYIDKINNYLSASKL